MPDIFLSYSREDAATVRRFAAGFVREGFDVWWDQSIQAGEAFDQVIEKALDESRAVVVLWSSKSVDSRWVRAEAIRAQEDGRLLPVMIEPCKRPIMFELTHTVDLSQWRGEASDPAWQALVASVRRTVGREIVAAPPPPQAAPRERRERRRSWTWVVIAVAGMALTFVFPRWRPFHGERQRDERTMDHAGVTGPVTLAVLPFVNISSDREQEYFSDGLTEEILNQLAQVKDLRVTARTSSFAFKGKSEDLRTVGQQLGVTRILEGSVRKSGSQLRITAQLINAQDDTHLWSRTYDRELKDVFAIQDEIARAVTESLSITLDVGATSRARGGTTNLDAYDQYLRATALDRQHSGDKAIPYLREAVAQDPAFVSAWSALYYHLAGSLMYSAAADASSARKEMQQVGERVLALAPQSWQAQAIMARQFIDQHRWQEAQGALDNARAAGADFIAAASTGSYSPSNGPVDTLFLWDTGRIADSVPIVQRRVESDPLSLEASDSWQNTLLLANRLADTATEYRRSKQLVGNHGAMDSMAESRGMFGGGINAAAGRAIMNRDIAFMARLLPAEKRPKGPLDDAHALALFRELLADPGLTTGVSIYVAYYAGYLGDHTLALQAFRRSYVDLHGADLYYLWFPFWSSLRTEPGFKQLVRDLGLVDYWRQSGKWSDYCRPVGTDDFECH